MSKTSAYDCFAYTCKLNAILSSSRSLFAVVNFSSNLSLFRTGIKSVLVVLNSNLESVKFCGYVVLSKFLRKSQVGCKEV